MSLKSRSICAVVALGCLGFVPTKGEAGSAAWNNTSTNWNANADWTPGTGFPNGPVDIATFSATHSMNPNIASSVSINSLIFSGSADSYIITASASQTLTFEGLIPTIVVSNGTLNEINCPVILSSPTTIDLSDSHTFTFGSLSTLTATTLATDTLTIQNPLGSGTGILQNNSTTGSGLAYDTDVTLTSGLIHNNGVFGKATTANLSPIITITGGVYSSGAGANFAANVGTGASEVKITNGSVTNEVNMSINSSSGSTAIVMSGGSLLNVGNIGTAVLSENTGSGSATIDFSGGRITNDATSNAVTICYNNGLGDTSIVMSGGTLINTGSGSLATILSNNSSNDASQASLVFSDGVIDNENGSILNNLGVAETVFDQTGGAVLNADSFAVNSGSGTVDALIAGGTFANTNGNVCVNEGSDGGVTLRITGGTVTNTDGYMATNAGTGTAQVDLLISGGTVSNTLGADLMGRTNDSTASDVFGITGGSLYNDSTSTVGSSYALITFSGGTLETQGLVFADTYTQTAGANLIIDVASLLNAGSIEASSTADLGGILTVKAVSGFIPTPGEVIPFLTASSGVSGTFDKVLGSNLPSYLAPYAIYTPFATDIAFSPTTASFVSSSTTVVLTGVNQNNILVGRHLHDLHSGLASRRATQEVAANFPADEVTASLETPFPFRTLQEKRSQLTDKVVTSSRCANPWNAYLGAIGSVGEVKTKQSQQGCDYKSIGALAGFDYAYCDYGAGFLANYQYVDGDVKKQWGQFRINEVQASFYGLWVPCSANQFSINGIVGGGVQWYDISRTLSGASLTAKGTPLGFDVDTQLGAEYIISGTWDNATHARLEFVPMANIQYVYLQMDSYKEQDAGGYDLSVASQSRNSLRSFLGFRANSIWEYTQFSLRAEVDAGWQYEFLDRNQNVSFSPLSVGGITTTTVAVGAAPNTFLAGLDLFAMTKDKYQFEASYDFELNSLFIDHSFYVGFGKEF